MGPGLQGGPFPDDRDSEPALAVVCSPLTSILWTGVFLSQ